MHHPLFREGIFTVSTFVVPNKSLVQNIPQKVKKVQRQSKNVLGGLFTKTKRKIDLNQNVKAKQVRIKLMVPMFVFSLR